VPNRIRAFSFRMRRAPNADGLLASDVHGAGVIHSRTRAHPNGEAGPGRAKSLALAPTRRVVARVAVAMGSLAGVVGLAACSMLSSGSTGESEGPSPSASGNSSQNASASGGDAGVGDGAAENSASGDGASVPAHADGASLDASTSGDGESASTTGSDGSAPTSLVYPPYAGNGTIDDGIAQLNLYRTLVGQSPVTLDPVSSAGCAEHLQYLICAEATKGMGYLEHTETGVPSCATDGGGTAGVDSDLAWGESTTNGVVTDQSLGEAVDLWINGLYHRNPLLDPGLTKAGAASSGGYNCLDYGAPGNTATVVAASPVLFPPEGTTDVPETFGGFESPCPTAADPLTATTCGGSGFIVTANWYGWGTGESSAISAVSSVSMTDMATDAAVPLFAWYADTISGHDPAPGYVHNEIALVPQASLGPNTTYSVTIDSTISKTVGAEQATTLSWSFTTGTRTAPSL